MNRSWIILDLDGRHLKKNLYMIQRWPCSDHLMEIQEVSCLHFPLHLLQEFITLHLEDGKKSRPNICMIMMLHRFFYDNFKAV